MFLAADGRVKILDFGLARQAAAATTGGTDAATQLQQTDPGTVMGTVGYMAPEQVKAATVDHRADIFSLGLRALRDGERPAAVHARYRGRNDVGDSARGPAGSCAREWRDPRRVRAHRPALSGEAA